MKDEDYLEECFPKGEKFSRRGEAIVLLALARQEGRKECLKEINDLQKQTVRDSASYQVLNQLKNALSQNQVHSQREELSKNRRGSDTKQLGQDSPPSDINSQLNENKKDNGK